MLEVSGVVRVPTRPLAFAWVVLVGANSPLASLVRSTFGFFCAPALCASVSPLLILPSPFGRSFGGDVAVLCRGPD